MARLTRRDLGRAPVIERPDVEGLVPGRDYRLRHDYVPRSESARAVFEGALPDSARPVVTYREGAPAGTKHEGRGGWFVDADNRWHFYLAEDVEEVTAGGLTLTEQAGTECVAGDGRKKYSKGLCTRCYGRWRKLAKEQGVPEDEAMARVKEMAAPGAAEGEDGS